MIEQPSHAPHHHPLPRYSVLCLSFHLCHHQPADIFDVFTQSCLRFASSSVSYNHTPLCEIASICTKKEEVQWMRPKPATGYKGEQKTNKGYLILTNYIEPPPLEELTSFKQNTNLCCSIANFLTKIIIMKANHETRLCIKLLKISQIISQMQCVAFHAILLLIQARLHFSRQSFPALGLLIGNLTTATIGKRKVYRGLIIINGI